MAEIPRNKGQFTQAGTLLTLAAVGGSVVNHDGTVALDTLLNQDEFPVLYSVIGDGWTDTEKGDDPNTQFRTPPQTGLPELGPNFVYRLRF